MIFSSILLPTYGLPFGVKLGDIAKQNTESHSFLGACPG